MVPWMPVEAQEGWEIEAGGESCSECPLHPAVISLPSMYQGLVRGLCGNFDKNPKNEFMLPNGALTRNINNFANSWEVKMKGGLACFSR